MRVDELKEMIDKIGGKVDKGFADLNKRVTRLETTLVVLGGVMTFLVSVAAILTSLYLSK